MKKRILILDKGYDVTAINKDPAHCQVLAQMRGLTVMTGDGSKPFVLEDAAAEQADIAIALTPRDDDNLVICQLCKKLFHIRKTVSLTASPEKVRITGPKTLINKIDKVNASIELDGNTEDFTQDVNLTIIDKNQEVLTDSEMNSLRIENNAKVTVTAKLWKIRQGVQISADYVGTPAEGYQVGAVRTVPDTISVAGSAEGLESLADNNNVITIPEDSIDISGESEDVEKKISLTNLLPDNVKLTSDSSEDVWVTVSILPAGSREFEFPTKNIEVKNKPKDLQVTFETAQIEVRIKSDNKDLDDLNNDKDIKASIDLDGKKEGSYEVPVEIVLPDGYETVEDVTTEVVISSGTAVDDSKENKE